MICSRQTDSKYWSQLEGTRYGILGLGLDMICCPISAGQTETGLPCLNTYFLYSVLSTSFLVLSYIPTPQLACFRTKTRFRCGNRVRSTWLLILLNPLWMYGKVRSTYFIHIRNGTAMFLSRSNRQSYGVCGSRNQNRYGCNHHCSRSLAR